jgi:hypothetical protein
MLHKQKGTGFRCQVMFENEHTCSCASGVSRGLATRATLTGVSRGRLGLLEGGGYVYDFGFLP